LLIQSLYRCNTPERRVVGRPKRTTKTNVKPPTNKSAWLNTCHRLSGLPPARLLPDR
jgi:hypothetical protein